MGSAKARRSYREKTWCQRKVYAENRYCMYSMVYYCIYSILEYYLFVQVCKHFLAAVDKNLYGWFWNCPNGNKCIYRHALPPGFVLKKKEQKGDKEEISIEEFIETEVFNEMYEMGFCLMISFLNLIPYYLETKTWTKFNKNHIRNILTMETEKGKSYSIGWCFYIKEITETIPIKTYCISVAIMSRVPFMYHGLSEH